MTTLVKATTRGQITLPARWRKNFSTDQYLLKEKEGTLEISPVNIKALEKKIGEYTVFDAIRDNEGRGITAKDLVRMLKKSL